MGLRFRKSIQLMPGVRLNVSGSGVSASLGPRGASISIGSRGTYANVGIPGTGLSYRERLDTRQPRGSSRSTYRQLLTAQRELDREVARATAALSHAHSESVFEGFNTVLMRRNREPYSWHALWGARGQFQPEPFVVPAHVFTESEGATFAAEAVPLTRWLVAIALLLGVCLWLGSLAYKVTAIAVAAGTGIWIYSALQTRRRLVAQYMRSNSEEYARDIKVLERAHASRQLALEQEWNATENARTQVRSSAANGHFETLARILEGELANEDFPVPLVFELEMQSADAVSLELSLPEITEVPEHRTLLTKTGKVSLKPLTQRDRVGIYTDLCAGMALRLVYETFRVLPTVQSVEIFGTAAGIDAATGHPVEFVALQMTTDRLSFDQLNLDALDPSAAVTGLGGRLSISRSGEPTPLPGVVGLTD